MSRGKSVCHQGTAELHKLSKWCYIGNYRLGLRGTKSGMVDKKEVVAAVFRISRYNESHIFRVGVLLLSSRCIWQYLCYTQQISTKVFNQ